jgi:hypothetical protein
LSFCRESSGVPAPGDILHAFYQLVGSGFRFVRFQDNPAAIQNHKPVRNVVGVIDIMADEHDRSTAFLRLPDEVEDFF